MRRKRFFAALIDCALILLLGQILLMLIVTTRSQVMMTAVFSLLFTMILCKDLFQGRSIGKYLLKIQVWDEGANHVAKRLKTIFRNAFLCLWPIEFVFFLSKQDKRLGDYALKTKVVFSDSKQPIKITFQDVVTFFVCFGLVFAVTELLILLFRSASPLVNLLYV